VEFFGRSTVRIADFDRWHFDREYLLKSIVGHRDLPTLSRPFIDNFVSQLAAHRSSRCAVLPTPSANVYNIMAVCATSKGGDGGRFN